LLHAVVQFLTMGTFARQPLIYRVTTQTDWVDAQATGLIPLSPLDRESGYIHLSSIEEVEETATRYFNITAAPVALAIHTENLEGELKWEAVATRDGALFPHLYGRLRLEDVAHTVALNWAHDRFTLGEEQPVG
jgi:uncharacterized protein (DUF952 family)